MQFSSIPGGGWVTNMSREHLGLEIDALLSELDMSKDLIGFLCFELSGKSFLAVGFWEVSLVRTGLLLLFLANPLFHRFER